MSLIRIDRVLVSRRHPESKSEHPDKCSKLSVETMSTAKFMTMPAQLHSNTNHPGPYSCATTWERGVRRSRCIAWIRHSTELNMSIRKGIQGGGATEENHDRILNVQVIEEHERVKGIKPLLEDPAARRSAMRLFITARALCCPETGLQPHDVMNKSRARAGLMQIKLSSSVDGF